MKLDNWFYMPFFKDNTFLAVTITLVLFVLAITGIHYFMDLPAYVTRSGGIASSIQIPLTFVSYAMIILLFFIPTYPMLRLSSWLFVGTASLAILGGIISVAESSTIHFWNLFVPAITLPLAYAMYYKGK